MSIFGQDTGLPKQTWATFLRNHAKETWACDFLQTYDLLFRSLLVFVVIELGSRHLVHFGVTKNPTDAWLAQQLQEATPFVQGPPAAQRWAASTNPRRIAATAACVRSATPSFCRMVLT